MLKIYINGFEFIAENVDYAVMVAANVSSLMDGKEVILSIPSLPPHDAQENEFNYFHITVRNDEN
jgi:hypothetical protein